MYASPWISALADFPAADGSVTKWHHNVRGNASKKGTDRFCPTARAPKKSPHTGSKLQHHTSFASVHKSSLFSCLSSSFTELLLKFDGICLMLSVPETPDENDVKHQVNGLNVSLPLA
ncbi:hypothetical protein X777_04353 [Ooceraea biroi]|uniref:Uncharacterized protein n=1 Tax=Ooceraea biroi TaxID=2015173 RepID=A0A026WHE5_OOCBI|nr:hypothetical protein X777_04353 [Ooceraea biroi]